MKKSTLNRMLELADIKPIIKESKMSLSNFELVKESANGNTYAIVRENKKYFIKSTETKDSITESQFDYIGGISNKNKTSFSSFEKATRHLNLMFEEINNHYDVENVNILESNRLDEKKFVLKMKKKKSAPVEEPAAEEPTTEEPAVEDEFDAEGGDEFDFDAEGDTEGGDESVEEFGGEETDEDLELDDSEDNIKDIQSTTGKLGQQLRDTEDISSDMQKWVAKSVLSALDLDNMDSEDKKDIIRTVKKKSKEEEPEEDVESSEEELDFDFEDDSVEESYDSYMDDNVEDIDQMVSGDKIPYPGGSGIPKRPLVKQETNPRIRRPERPLVKQETNPRIRRPERPLVKQEYNSYMEDDFNEKEYSEWLSDMEEAGIMEPTVGEYDDYDSYMEDVTINTTADNPQTGNLTRAWESEGKEYKQEPYDEDNPNIGGDEDDLDDKLLLDTETIDDNPYDLSNSEAEALYGPNTYNKSYSRDSSYRAEKQANKDISKHYNKSAAPGYEIDPVEKWRKHKLPYDTEFIGEHETIEQELGLPPCRGCDMSENIKRRKRLKEDHLNDKMDSYEQEKAYEDVETVVRRYGMDVELREKSTSEDPEETLIYLDIVDGNDKLLVSRINSVGDIEVGEMRGNKFTGEPVDSVEDFIEIFVEDLTNKEREQLEMEESIEMSPQPQRAPEEQPSQPETKPGAPDKTPGKDRPSRRPFTPPPEITPGEEPGPKAGDDSGTHNPETLPDGSPRPWQDGMGKPPWLDNDNGVEFE